jgi:hypothetical protein
MPQSKEKFNSGRIGSTFNDASVVKIMSKEALQDSFGSIDSALLTGMELSDPKVSLGMINMLEKTRIINAPLTFLKEPLAKNNKIYVNGVDGYFDYEVEMDIQYPCVVEDITEDDYPGIDGALFPLVLTMAYSPGDILTYDFNNGEQVIVSEDEEVRATGSGGYIHMVTLNNPNRQRFFPKTYLRPGTKFFRLDTAKNEYSLQGSAPHFYGGITNKVGFRYYLGSHRSVTVGVSAYAEALEVSGPSAEMFKARLDQLTQRYGEDAHLAIAPIKGIQGNRPVINKDEVRIQPIAEAMAMATIYEMTANGMMFNRGNTITGQNGSKRINEGIYPQLRRGHHYEYNNSDELKAYIRRASAQIYEGTGIDVTKRHMVFRCGYHAYNAMRDMFMNEFKTTTPVHVDQEVIPYAILEKGSDRYNTIYQSFAIGQAFLNGIGNVKIEHDPSFDYDLFNDYQARGYSGAGMSKRAWTMIMWDISDSMYSNARDPRVLHPHINIDERAQGGNLYIVKPKGMPDFAVNHQRGQSLMNPSTQATGDWGGMKMTVHSAMAAWIPDKSRVVILEKP